MRLLITGATGFVGVNLVRGLAASPSTTVTAADVRAPDDLIEHYWLPVRDRIKVVQLDVTHADDFLDIVEQDNITHILHCAAITPSPADERTRPDLVSTVNLIGALNALEAARRVDSVQRLLLMSSSGVYAMPDADRDPDVLIDEDSPLALDNLYAITKYSAELLAARYRTLSDKNIAAVRLGAFYGPLERPSSSRQHMSVPGRLLAALRAEQALTIAGPEITRDWIYADEAAAAIAALLTAPRWRHDVYNLGAGRAISLREMANAFVDQGLRVTWVDAIDSADIGMRTAQGRQTMSIRRIVGDTEWKPTPDPRGHVAKLCAQPKIVQSG